MASHRRGAGLARSEKAKGSAARFRSGQFLVLFTVLPCGLLTSAVPNSHLRPLKKHSWFPRAGDTAQSPDSSSPLLNTPTTLFTLPHLVS